MAGSFGEVTWRGGAVWGVWRGLGVIRRGPGVVSGGELVLLLGGSGDVAYAVGNGGWRWR